MIHAFVPELRQGLQQAVLVLKEGGVVAFPTETYYGLAVDPFNPQAVERLFRLKNRAAAKPIALLVDRQARLSALAAEIPCLFQPLIDRFWPGPLTLIFPAHPNLPPILTAGSETIGVRISSHPLALALSSLAGGAITATSANHSERRPAVSEEEVVCQFGTGLDCLVRGGMTQGGAPSTIVSLDHGRLRLIREGAIPFSRVLDDE